MHVFFATPTLEKNVSVEFHKSMLESIVVCVKHRIAFQAEVHAGLQFIDLARNRLVDHFLKSDATDLLFIDADQGWDAAVLPRILRYEEEIVCGLPPKKCDPPTFHSNALTGVMQNGLFQSLEAGTGFMRIKRSVFAKLDRAYPELKTADRENKEIPYFQTGIRKGGFLGEDIFFCRQWVGIGEYLWIDSDISFTHQGSKTWKGNFYDHAVQNGLLKTS